MKKAVYFLRNGVATSDDKFNRSLLEKEGYKVGFSNGSVTNGFKQVCSLVVMNDKFDHVIEWCEYDGIEWRLSSDFVEDAEFVEIEEVSEEEDEESEEPDDGRYEELKALTVAELKEMADGMGLKVRSNAKEDTIIKAIMEAE